MYFDIIRHQQRGLIVNKYEAAEIVKNYVLSFENLKDNDDDRKYLYVHENGRPQSLIHFNDTNETYQRTFCLYEKYLTEHIFFIPSPGSDKNHLKVAHILSKSINQPKLAAQERSLGALSFLQSYCAALEKISSKHYEMMLDERIDQMSIRVDDTTGQIVIGHTTAFFSYAYPSVYVTFLFDIHLNLINIVIQDNYVRNLMNSLSMEKKIQAFAFFIDYFVEKEYRTLVGVDYKEIGLDTLDDYLLLHAMKEL